MKYENLCKACVVYVANRYTFFRSSLQILPRELIDEVETEVERKRNEFQIINGQIFPVENTPTYVGKSDWGCYQ